MITLKNSRTLFVLLLLFAGLTSAVGQSIDPALFQALEWRCIGPHRGGRALAVSGVRGKPNTFYFGAVGGGVWKTTDGGHEWNPIFDSQPISSIGALTVAPSDENVIYVGSGEADMRSDISYGDGMYKSTDAGQSWKHIGLRDTRQIGRVLVDPRNPNIVLVAALGHGFGPNEERGVFRSTDGGEHWSKVLYKDASTGAIELAADPDNFNTVYTALWNTRRPAWSVYAPVTGPGGGLFKSTDAGITWTEVRGGGLPTGQLGRIGIDVAAGQQGKRVFALIDAPGASGLYRSDDSGATWKMMSTDPRILSRAWYFSEVRVDPKNPNIVYVSNVSLYRSIDGGKTFVAIKGAPGGDDYHSLWIDPDDPNRMVSGVDQGVIISVDGAASWSTWYNQPTAQFYHVAVDNQFPYWVYGAQQDSGTAAVVSRSDYGQITFRDWHPIGAGESGYIVPDPVDPNVVFGGSTGGDLYRFESKTGQVEDVSPTPMSVGARTRHRYPWTTPIAFSLQPPYALYQSSQFVMKTIDKGKHWSFISPDLTLRPAENEAEAKGVIYTLAPSPVQAGQLWVGTDNGLIQLTLDDGKSWKDVSPPDLAPWSMISLIDASPFDAGTAYAAIDRHQMDDIRPHIYRTRDFGKTWTKIDRGIADNAYVHVVRTDTRRKGLLFAGTELGVYVSFDDGDQWQPLQLNLPVTPVRDLVVKGNDLVIATHGRSFWILDDITPLRLANQRLANSGDTLFTPAAAIRLRKNESRDTPLPRGTPAGKNPPTGAIIDYVLQSAPKDPITLAIYDSTGILIRKYSSGDLAPKLEESQSFPTYWLPAPVLLPAKAGMNRFVWDLRYERPRALRYGYSISAVPGNAIMEPEGPLVLPGKYEVRLSVNGNTLSAPLEVKMDPRVHPAPTALREQLAVAQKISEAMQQSYETVLGVRSLLRQTSEVEAKLADRNRPVLDALKAFDGKLKAIGGSSAPVFPAPSEPTLSSLNGALAELISVVGSADTAPTQQASESLSGYKLLLDHQIESWQALKEKDLKALNAMLKSAGQPELVP
ncbi:MAG TPA: hypothetical protein VGN86_13085 [Pyrinomonadaceae bacterium]|nr:hypothetical protein [Pyrinomonadaceae bacterium]